MTDLERLQKKQIRECRTMHECCVCLGTIRAGDDYYDGGHGNRGHVHCVDNARQDELDEDGFCPSCAHPICERCGICPMCGHGVGT